MNIKIIDSWLREYLYTKADAKKIGKILSDTSVSVEKIDKTENDSIYNIEVTTNRVDLMSVLGIAKEAAAVLPQEGITATFKDLKINTPSGTPDSFPIEIENDPKLVGRICAVAMEVNIGESPKYIKERLINSDIRSLNNLIDVTNYIMRETGHPAHVFDLDLLPEKMIIREAKRGEKVVTLDNKEYVLNGGEIVASSTSGEIVDLLGIMGTKNTVVNDKTKKVLLFIDNNNKVNIRRASMNLGIRTEAAILNEKGVDPELAMKTLIRGIELYQKVADGKLISKILDIYPNKPKLLNLEVGMEKINKIIGIDLNPKECVSILNALGFEANQVGDKIKVAVPTNRIQDVQIPEDLVEEIARVYGYSKIPSTLPAFFNNSVSPFADAFYFENRIKQAMKYWGFMEVYTNSMVSEDNLDGPTQEAVTIKNPLTSDMVYLRKSLVPGLLDVIKNNKADNAKIFEISNIYSKKSSDLPDEKINFAAVVKKQNNSFFEIKGIIEQILKDLGIDSLQFKQSQEAGLIAEITKDNVSLGKIEVLDTETIDFELNMENILKFASLKKIYKPFAKFPPIVEDLSITVVNIETQELINEIMKQNNTIVDVSLKDQYNENRTFHIVYQDPEKNLTNEDVAKIRRGIIDILKQKFNAQVKE